MPDLHEPLPDRAHEMLRQSVAAAIDRLEEQVQRINDAFLLLSVTADFSQATKNTSVSAQKALAQQQATVSALKTRADADRTRDDTAQADIDALQEQVAALAARVAALENP
jgi:polyhydroxyalkanoate synthesis regulator phasin